MKARIWLILGLKVVAIAAALLVPAMPQPLEYHDFSDARPAFGIDNFLDVTSNFAFLVVGIAGLVVALGRRARFEYDIERWPYVIFFVGVLLTAIGSSYYHLSPDNETLFWDRLPMTVAFMALVCSQIVDRISVRAGLVLLLPMLVLGALSVLYWRTTERAGMGNVIPYGILQGYSVVILLLLARMKPSRYTHGHCLYWVFAWYVFSKFLETFDSEIHELTHVVSGHTLKHIAAAIAGVAVCRMLLQRTPSADASPSVSREPALAAVRAATFGPERARRERESR